MYILKRKKEIIASRTYSPRGRHAERAKKNNDQAHRTCTMSLTVTAVD